MLVGGYEEEGGEEEEEEEESVIRERGWCEMKEIDEEGEAKNTVRIAINNYNRHRDWVFWMMMLCI